MEISEKTLGIWMVAFDRADWIGTACLCKEGVRLVHRLRFHVDDKTFNSADRKEWFEHVSSEPEAQALDDVHQLWQQMYDDSGGVGFELLAKDFTTMDAFMKAFLDMPGITHKNVHAPVAPSIRSA